MDQPPHTHGNCEQGWWEHLGGCWSMRWWWTASPSPQLSISSLFLCPASSTWQADGFMLPLQTSCEADPAASRSAAGGECHRGPFRRDVSAGRHCRHRFWVCKGFSERGGHRRSFIWCCKSAEQRIIPLWFIWYWFDGLIRHSHLGFYRPNKWLCWNVSGSTSSKYFLLYFYCTFTWLLSLKRTLY